MNLFTLLYLFYSAKLSIQASIYFIWLSNKSSRTIAYIYGAVAILAGVPFSHVIVRIFSAKPLSNPIFIVYLSFSFLLTILWYKPTQDGEQRVLPFAVVTAFDLLDLFFFLFQRQIGRWHDTLTSDIEQGHLRVGTPEDASIALVGRNNEQVHHGDLTARPEPPQDEMHRLRIIQEAGYHINAINRSGKAVGGSVNSGGRGFAQTLDGREAGGRSASAEVATTRPENVEWDSRMLQNWCEEEEEADSTLRPQQRQSEVFINLGIDAGSRLENPPSPQTPAATFNDTHPAYRPTLPSEMIFE